MLTRKRKAVIDRAESSKHTKSVENEDVISCSNEISNELERGDIHGGSEGHLFTPAEETIRTENITLNKGETIVLELEVNKIGDSTQIIRDDNCEDSINKNGQLSLEEPKDGDSYEKVENPLKEPEDINIVNITSGVLDADNLDGKQCPTQAADCLDNNQYSDLAVVKQSLQDTQCPIVMESLDVNKCPTVFENSLNSKVCPIVVTNSLNGTQSSAVKTDSLNDNETPSVSDSLPADLCPSLMVDSLEIITPVSVTPPNINKDSAENKQANKKKGKSTKSGSSTPSKMKELRRYESSPWKLTPEQSIEHFRALNEQLMLLNQQGRNLSSTIHRPKIKIQTQSTKDDVECNIYNSGNFEVDLFESGDVKSSTPAKKRNIKRLKTFKSPKKPSLKKSHKKDDPMTTDEIDKSPSKNSHEDLETVDKTDKSSSKKSQDDEDREIIDEADEPDAKKSRKKKVMVTLDETDKQSSKKCYKKKSMVTTHKRSSSKKCRNKEDMVTLDEAENLTIDEMDKLSSKKSKEKDMIINKIDEQSLKSSVETDDLEVIDETELENVLEENARRNHLTAINVKNILHHVITNEDVLNMLKNTIREKKGNKPTNFPDIIYEPTLTRSKVKELIQKGSCPWPITPIKKPPKHFVEENFDEEESSDEDYKPDEEEEEEEERETEDEESFISSQTSEAESTPLPCTPRKSVTDEVVTTEPAADEETNDHSNLLANAAPISPIESPLSPNTIEDQDKDITKEEADLIALRTRSKLPLNDTPLDVIEASFVAPDITTDMYDCSCVDEDWKNFLVGFMKPDPDLNDTFDDEVNDPEYNFLEDEDILQKEEELEKEELRNDRAVQISKQELKDLINEICEVDEEEEEDLTEKSLMEENLESPLLTSQMIVEAVIKPSPSSSGIEIFITMTNNERKQLDDQMRKHVQLMTQIYILTRDFEDFQQLAEECKMFLNELKTFGKTSPVGEKSAFNAMNLAEAVEIINNERPPPKKFDITTHIKRYNSDTIFKMPDEIKEILITSKVFMYPDYLPTTKFILGSKSKKFFTQAEDNLIALGLHQFQSFDKPEKLIQLYIIPIKTVDQIKIRIKNLRSKNAKFPNTAPEAFAYYMRHHKAPDFPRIGLDFDPSQVKAPIDQLEKCPKWVEAYHQKSIEEKNYSISTPIEVKPRNDQRNIQSKTLFNQSNVIQAAAKSMPINITPESSPIKPLNTSSYTTRPQILSGMSLLTLRTPVPSPLTVFMTASPDKNIVCTTSINTELRTNVFTLVPSPVNVISTSPIKTPISLTSSKAIVTTSVLASTSNSIVPQGTTHSSTISSAPIFSFSNISNSQLQSTPIHSIPIVVSGTNTISSIQTHPTYISSTFGLNTIQRTPEKIVKMHPLLPNLSPKAVAPVKQVSPLLEKQRKEPIKRLQSLKSILPKPYIYVSPVKKAAAMLNALERKRQKNSACRHLLPKLTLNLRSNGNQPGFNKKMHTVNITKELESLPDSPENVMEMSSPAGVDFSEIEYLGVGPENTVENINECPDIDSQSDVDNDDINDDINNVTEDENQDAINNDNDDDLAELMAASTTIRSTTRRPTINRKKKLQRKIESTVAMLAPDLVEKDPLKDERNTALAQSYLNQVKKAFKNDMEKYEDFLRALHEFQQNPSNSVLQLYKNMSEILKDHPALLEDFSGFLLPEEAEECGVFLQNKAFVDARSFLRKLEVQFSDHPAYFQRILKIFIQWQSNPNCCLNDLQDSIKPLLRSHPYLMNEFLSLFPNEKPPDSYMYNFEEISLEETNQDSLVSQDDNFEYVNIPDNGDELYGTKKCVCQCHKLSTNLKILKRSRHCPACGVKFINGHIYVLTTGMTPRPVQVVYLNNGPPPKDNVNKELGDEAKENIKTGSSSSLKKDTRESSTISSPKKNKGNILKEKKIAPQKSLCDQLESIASDVSPLFNSSSISQHHSQNASQVALSEVNTLPSLQSNFLSKASQHITVLSPAGDTQPFDVSGTESIDISDSELSNVKSMSKELELDSQRKADSKTGDGQKEEKQERIILRISLNTGSKNETGPTAETDFDDSTKLSERRTLEQQNKPERNDKKSIETNKAVVPEENSGGEGVSSAKIPSVWTKNADREILQTCQLKGRATDDIFHSIAVKLGNKTTAEVKVRFQQLMALFSKQVHDSDSAERGSPSGSEDD